MAVGRISGPLLAQNLFRDNVPLAFYNTTSAEAPVLYLDIAGAQVGILKDTPAYALDVGGTVNADRLRIIENANTGSGVAEIGLLTIHSGTIDSTVGPITIAPAALERIILQAAVSATGVVTVLANQGSNSITTGSLVVTGGVGISENLYVGAKFVNSGTTVLQGIVTINSETHITKQTQSISTQTGSLVVDGGVGIWEDLWVGGRIHGTVDTSTFAFTASYAITSTNVAVTSTSIGRYFPTLAATTSGDSLVFSDSELTYEGGTLTAPQLVASSATSSISTSTGALVVNGGVGIAENLNVGGTATVRSTATFNSTASSVSSTSGAVVIKGGVGIGGDLNVAGNIHAIGNITAEGNIQLGNSTGTDTLTVDAEITSDLIPQVDDKYTVGNTDATWAEGYFNNIYTKVIESQKGNVTINSESGLLEVNANIKVNGTKPIGTAPVVTNILYVSVDGSDTNDGRAADASRACRTVGGAIKSPYYAPGTSIKVAPGRYLENNPLLLLPYTSVIGSDLRTTSIEPINKTQDLFHLQSGCYLAQMQFLNGRSGLLPGVYANGYNRGAYATSFPPSVNGQKIDLYHSPYVQNCTNQNGPWLLDGTMFIPNQTIQVPSALGTGAWTENTNTLVVTVTSGTIAAGMSINAGHQESGFFSARTLMLANKPFVQEQVVAYVNQTYPGFVYNQALCYRDVGIIVENLAYDATFGGNEKSVEAGLAYFDGVISKIAGQESETVAAINYIKTLLDLIVTNSTAPNLLGVAATFAQVKNTVLGNGAVAIASIDANVATITDIITNGISVAPNKTLSSGPDSDFLSAEVLLQANRKFIQSDTLAWIANTYPEFDYNQEVCYRDVGLIIDAISQDIILGGNSKTVEAALSYYKGGYNQILGQESTTTQAINHARDISLQIIANQAVTKQAAFSYNKVKCARDTGLIVDALAFDLLYDGTSQSAFAGLQYWNQNGYTGAIASEISTTTSAISYLKTLATTVVAGHGSAVTVSVTANFDVILNILQAGTANVTDTIVSNGAASSDSQILTSYNLLLNNKSSMADQVLAYIASTAPDFVYDQATCRRDIGYIIDSVAFDLLHGGNKQSVMSGVYYYGFSPTSTAIPNERPQVSAAYDHIKTLMSSIVRSTTATTYQTTITQVTSSAIGGTTEITALTRHVDLITSIIGQGPSAAPAHRPISLTALTSTSTVNAYNLLLANKEFIKAEVIAFIDYLYSNNDTQVINTYYSGGEVATMAVSRNFKIITDVISNGPELAPIIFQGAGVFAPTGINAADTKIATKILSVTQISGNVYNVVIDTNTVDANIGMALYFGDTAIFPKQDADVPDEWSQRRVDQIGGMGGSLVDGAVCSDRSPINSFVYDAFTQVNQGGRGIHIINNGYAQLVSVFTIFCSTAVEVDSGGIASITNSNSNFGNFCLVSKGYGKREFSGTVYNPNSPWFVTNGQYYPNGYFPINGQVLVFVPDAANRPHIALVMEVEPPIDHLNDQGLPGFLTGASNTGTITTGSITISGISTDGVYIGQSVYIRDQYGRTTDGLGNPYISTGTIITDVGFQTLTLNKAVVTGGGDPGNNAYFTIYTCGKAYYNVLSSSVFPNPVPVGNTMIPGIQGAEATALVFINSLTQQIITNTPVVSYSTITQTIKPSVAGGSGAGSFISDRINTIIDIAQNGTNVAPTITKSGTIPTGAGSAIELINSNIEFITQETLAVIDAAHPSTNYNEAKCARDTGLIIDAIALDMLFNGTSQSTFAGLQYYSQSGYTGDISNEVSTTTRAINYLSYLAQRVVRNVTTGTRYQTSATQVLLVSTATETEANTIGTDFSVITSILNQGTVGVTDLIVPNGVTTSSNVNVQTAYALLQANKSYLQEEVAAWVEGNTHFSYNETKCSRDTGLIVDSLAIDLLYPTANDSQTTFAGLQYWAQAGYTGAIGAELTTTTNAVNYLKSLAEKIIVNDRTGTRYQSTVTQTTGTSIGTVTQVATLEAEFTLITNIINSGTVGVTDLVVPNGPVSGTVAVVSAYNLLKNNKAYLQAEVAAYVEATKTPGFVYDNALCKRDVGYMVDSVAFDLLHGGNRQAIQSGVYYYNFNGATAVPKELPQVTAAYQRLSDIAALIITGNTVTPSVGNKVSQVTGLPSASNAEVFALKQKVSKLIDIITNGPSVAPAKSPVSLTASVSGNVVKAYNALVANRAFIKAEIIAYIDSTFRSAFAYDRAKCERDSGIIVDSVVSDILFPTTNNSQATFAGLQYWNQNGYTGAIGSEITTTTNAIKYIKTLAQKVLVNDVSGTRYQSTITQVVGTATTVAQVTAVGTEFDIITNILTSGTSGVTDLLIGNGIDASTSTDITRAYTLLQANKAYLQAEAVAWVDYNRAGGYDRTKCVRDTGIIVDSVVADVLFPTANDSQTTFAGLQYWAQGGYTGVIASELTTTTNAINYLKTLVQKVVVNDNSGIRYQTGVAQVLGSGGTGAEAATLAAELTIITNIINNGTAGVTDLLVGNGINASSTSSVVNAYTLLEANKAYLQAEVIAYVDATKTPGFTYDPVLCARDVGYMLDSIAFDLLYGGNRQAIQSGVYYYSYNASVSQIPNETTATIAAFNYIKAISQQIVQNQTVSGYQSAVVQNKTLPAASSGEAIFVGQKYDVITNIIANGPTVASTKSPISLTKSADVNAQRAADILKANKAYIQAEVIAYLENVVAFKYDRTKCSRDIGYMVDSISFDILYGGNRQAIQSGVYYYSYNASSSAIPNESTATVAAFNHIKTISQQIIQNQTVSTYQSSVTQNKTLPASSGAEATILGQKYDIITNIIVNGPSVVTTREPISLTKTGTADALKAGAILKANRAFIQAETIAFLENQYGFHYDNAKCKRDVAYMVDSVSFDLLYGGNKQAVQSAVYYYGFNASSSAIEGQSTQTQVAYNFIKSIVPYIIKGITTSTHQQTVSQVIPTSTATNAEVTVLGNKIDVITNIIANGPTVAATPSPIGLTHSTDNHVTNAANALIANREFIKAEVIAYIDLTLNLNLDKVKCARDVRLILQQLVYDLQTGGNYNSVNSGLSYWSRQGTYHLVQLGDNISNPALTPDGSIVNFYQRSYMSASGYLFEYVGAGVNYGSLPQVGTADPIQSREVVMLDGGKVFFTSTDQNGDFRIGPELVISQATGVLSGRTFTKSLFANLTPFILAIEAG